MILKQRIRNQELTLGSWVTIPHPSVVEILATAEFDWLTIDIEHSAIDFESVQQLIATIQGHHMKALVRVSDNDEVIIKRVLDAGADGIIVPMVKSKEDAKKMIDAVYYPPKGKRGVGLSRAQQFGIGFEEYKKRLEDEIILIAQIEHVDAITNLEDILAFDEIDATLIGPYDLSASMGKPGQYHDEDVRQTVSKYDDICKKLNKPLGAHVISSDSSETQEKIDKGYSFVAFSLDFFFLGDTARNEMKKLRS